MPHDAYENGTTLDGCFESEGNASNTSDAAQADGFCGNLIYHKDIPEVTHVSAADQDFPGGSTDDRDYNRLPDPNSDNPVGTWDVVRTHHQGWEFSTCLPICSNDTIQGESGEILWDVVHNTGHALNLTHDNETARNHADNQTDNRWQTFGPHIQHPMAAHVIQDTAGLWEFNGWTSFSAVQGYIGFLYDHNNDPITDEELRDIVADMKDPSTGDFDTQLLPSSAAPLVCGFTPNFEFTNTGDQPGTACEFEFQYRGHHDNDGDVQDGFKDEDGYERRCSSPTYFCEPTNDRGGAWYYSNGCLCIGYPSAGGLISDEGGQTGYLKWHWVVAPHASACNGAQEPGIAMQGSGSAQFPYLSHDLDIYTPITSLAAWQDSSAVPATRDHAHAVADEEVTNVEDRIEGITPSAVDQVVDQAESETSDTVNQTWRIYKLDRTEPNSNLELGSLSDNSQNLPVTAGGDLLREFGGACDLLTSQEEPHTVDPWANVIDSEAYDVVDEATDVTTLTEWEEFTYYGDDPNKHQDDANSPGPGVYAIEGTLGMFADKSSEGAYEPLAPDHKNEGKDMAEAGAWPMHWNMHLFYNDTSQQYEPDTENGGCRDLTHANTPFTEHMVKAGFGADSGLIQGIYLEEPTAFADVFSRQSVEYPVGNNIYLSLSPGVQTLIEENATIVGGTEVVWDPDGSIQWDADFDPNAWETAQQTEEVIRELKAHAAEDEAIVEESVNVHVPVLDTTEDWGFDDQCDEDTGGFSSNLDFVHQCETGCEQDAIVTAYTAELTDGTVGGDLFPEFTAASDTAYDFGDRVTWVDVDPFNGDPDANLIENTAPCGSDQDIDDRRDRAEDRIECPREVRNLTVAEQTADNVTLDWEPAPEVANLTADHGDIVYNVYRNGSSSQDLVAENVAFTNWTDEDATTESNAYDVSYNVTAKYQYATPVNDIPDREGPASELVVTIPAAE